MSTFLPSSGARVLLLVAALPAAPPAFSANAPQPARVWQETVVIPTYQDGLPDPNPPFDLFLPVTGGRLNYPYTLRNALTDVRTDKTWRALWLENEYLKCLVLPDLGGHLYGCTDKRNGQQMFYANKSIKPARIAYRGAWGALGVEFNFPVSHNWMTVSPVDFATTAAPDGSASVWVGNVDRPYGMQWRVQLTLQPGRAVLEQQTALYNRSDVRHRFYWWTNAGVEVWDDSKVLYPQERTASHGFTFVDTWPIDSAGHDLSVVGNHKHGPVSRFSHGSREPFMGVFHPKTKSGVVHWSSPVDLPSKKLWSFGSDADGLDWRRALSDDGSAYVEIQAGPFRNQETYGFLEPQQSMRFSEYWLPMLDLGGLSRANPDALLNLSRETGKPGFVTLNVALDALRTIPDARLTVADGDRTVLAETVSLTPAATLRRSIPGQLSAGTYTVRVVDAGGSEILRHTEGVYDYVKDDVRTGPQPMPKVVPLSERTDGDLATVGMQQERDGRLLEALSTYREGLGRYPESLELQRAAGRLMVALKQYEAAVPLLENALARVSNDREAAYYLGVAEGALGRSQAATVALENAQQYGPQRAAALLELAAVSSRSGARGEALDRIERAVAEAPDAVRAGGMQVALFRTLGRADSARARLKEWRAKDPTSSFLRFEGSKLGAPDDALWAHLAADPERILEIAVDYIRFGLFGDAIELLGGTYPSGAAVVSEPGMPHPSAYPLVAYYRGWCRRQTGKDGLPDYRAASAMPTTYVFPHRPESMTVLKDAVAANPNDATAHFLLGSLFLSGGMTDAALKSWEKARTLNPAIPTLHRNMGYALLSTGATDKAVGIFREGTKYDRANVGVVTGLEQALTIAGRPAAERAEALLAFPDQKALPSPLVFRLALALAEAGRFDEAERQFEGRFFAREEGGVNARDVLLEVRAQRARARADGKKSAGAPELRDSDVPYGVGSWDAERLGNHRAVLEVSAPAGAVAVRIPWRRRDADPGKKNLVVESATAGRIRNVARIDVNREFGDVVFEALSAGTFYVYDLPNVGAGRSNYPKVTYPAPEATADERWLAKHGLGSPDSAGRASAALPAATVTRFEAIDPFNSFFPMEVIATRAETADLLARHPDAAFLAFAEDRTNPIRMTDDLPLRWIRRGAGAPFKAEAERGEYYAFQVGVFAAKQAARNARVSISALERTGGGSVPASAFNCINTGGVDSASHAFTRAIDVEKGKVQAVWCGILVPEGTQPGDYSGQISVTAEGPGRAEIPFSLTVAPTVIAAHGDDEPWRLSRLRWLDSTLAVDDDLVKPFTPVTVAGNTVGVLGRSVTLDALGFPEQIESRFSVEMTHLAEAGRKLLTGPVRLAVESRDPAVKPWTGSGATIARPGPGAATWRARGDGGALTLDTDARMDFDGNIEFTVRVKAARATSVEDIRLEIPMAREVARYLMGLGFKGGARPASFDWTWDVQKNQDSAWVGDVNAGVQFTLKDEKYVRPLNTNFYTLKPLVMPASWHNGGKGGCRLADQGASTWLIRCFSGARALSEGETLFFNFRLLLTPFKTIDPKAQFTTRYFHAFKPVDDVLATGANVVNVHHAGPVNPYINYPFFRPAEMKAFVDAAHARDMRVKIYYTVRELANRAPELFALRSLGEEIFAPGPGGGFSWLQEHLGSNYIAAWFVPELKDAAVVNSGVSRWHNFYVEGLDWLARNVGIDGLYIDDVAFDRLTMKRVRKVLDRRRPSALIDLHSANQYNVRDGFASSTNLYLEHFPYLDRLWFGEYFDYGSAPDYWLTEISGIPFGLMGEMLQDNGNPWRGMVFGMTGRLPWAGDPRPLWKAWDRFGIADSRMIGSWVPGNPVKTGRTDVLATAYVRDGRTMVALASWAKEAVEVRLEVDWRALGLDEKRVRVSAPLIDGFQPFRTFDPSAPIPVEPGKGWLLLLESP